MLGMLIQMLESRLLMAGDVRVKLVGGTLILRGDAADNVITIERYGSGREADGSAKLRVHGDTVAGTASTLNGVGGVRVFRGVRSISLSVGGGDDRADLLNVRIPGRLHVRGGAGDDAIVIRELRAGGPMSIGGDEGEDRLLVSGAWVGGSALIRSGDGADQMALVGCAFGADAAVDGGGGADEITTGGSTFAAARRVTGGRGIDEVRDDVLSHRYDFADGSHDWAVDFADYPKGQIVGTRPDGTPLTAEEAYELDGGLRPLPAELGEPQRTGLLLAGRNNSDDLFLFATRRLDGLIPGQRYLLDYRVRFASDRPADAEAVSAYVRTGAMPRAPQVLPDPKSGPHQVIYRLNADLGSLGNSGRELSPAGRAHNGLQRSPGPEHFASRELRHTHEFPVAADADGRLWLVVGADSVFESTERLYVQSIAVDLIPVGLP